MSLPECDNKSLNSISSCVEEAKHKYSLTKAMYDRCKIKEEDESKCNLILKALKTAEWNYQTWKDYEKDRISLCESMKKYS